MRIEVFLGQLASTMLVALMFCAVWILRIFDLEIPYGCIGGVLLILFGLVLGSLATVLCYEWKKAVAKESVTQSEV